MQLLRGVDPPPPRVKIAPTRVSIATVPVSVEPVPIELVVVPVTVAPVAAVVPEPVAPVASSSSPPPRIAARASAAAVETAPAAAASAGVAVEPTGPVGDPAPAGDPYRPGILSMRGGIPVPDLSPRHVVEGIGLARIDGGRPPPAAIVPTGELVPSGNGTYHAEHGGFSADVARNGTVKFKDKPSFSIRFTLPNPATLAKASARGIEDWYRDPSAAIRAADRNPDTGEPVALAPPTAAKDLPPPVAVIPIIGGTSEITDWVMRRGGIDPYASAKRDFLERTRDERAALRLEREGQLLARSVQTMRSHATRAWARTDLDAAGKRAALFQLWDECLEDGDEEVVAAGNRARTALIGFVRTHLPAGSPLAYSPAELAALNRTRTSKLPFTPYE